MPDPPCQARGGEFFMTATLKNKKSDETKSIFSLFFNVLKKLTVQKLGHFGAFFDGFGVVFGRFGNGFTRRSIVPTRDGDGTRNI
ncbi:MAG: hypothetical protein NUV50_03495 [Rhodospirillales bacterium]|nr:hypothetical protein [Rhodospirillales bacterium]